MAQRLDHFAIFTCQQDGFDKEEVSRYLAKILAHYDRLYDENKRLKKKLQGKQQQQE